MLLKAILTLSLVALLFGCQTTHQVSDDIQATATGSEDANAIPNEDTNGVDMAELRKRRYWHYWHRSLR
ncbi:hypothetical protein [Rubellicoccus peritrichatus]|uniref:Uncharacterized protein n=1 Tax=Rubellicoccus peritrichatus TaxID=3080537 RepID=A0AAQ3QWI0_9BACT|nr:hypothetical protein [Puniceicoccus sp. CR14]WOO41912.1 hypothetical protein RZN69_02345 [Puniceicoccus sp. CR14]